MAPRLEHQRPAQVILPALHPLALLEHRAPLRRRKAIHNQPQWLTGGMGVDCLQLDHVPVVLRSPFSVLGSPFSVLRSSSVRSRFYNRRSQNENAERRTQNGEPQLMSVRFRLLTETDVKAVLTMDDLIDT